ncbi:MAG: hypothetical protein MHPSP_002968, partial [Paramarteilia canceri]
MENFAIDALLAECHILFNLSSGQAFDLKCFEHNYYSVSREFIENEVIPFLVAEKDLNK